MRDCEFCKVHGQVLTLCIPSLNYVNSSIFYSHDDRRRSRGSFCNSDHLITPLQGLEPRTFHFSAQFSTYIVMNWMDLLGRNSNAPGQWLLSRTLSFNQQAEFHLLICFLCSLFEIRLTCHNYCAVLYKSSSYMCICALF